MTQPIWIRLAGPADAALVADISRRTFIDSFGAHNTKENMDLFLSQQFTREMQMAEVGAPGRIFLLAFCGDEPAGYASMREGNPLPLSSADSPGPEASSAHPYARESAASAHPAGTDAIEILQIYSEQNMIGKGVGKALMERCLEVGRERNNEWIWLGVWEHNSRAIAFYRKFGFERFGEHVFMVGHDPQTDWWMNRKI